jgi:cysteine desulfurase
MREIYFDNAATTASSPAAVEAALEMMSANYGNPSSAHTMGLAAERAVKSAQESLAEILSVRPEEILFTSGGTESANLAVLGLARARRRIGARVITSQVEHPCVENAMKALEEEGFTVERLKPSPGGNIDPDAVLAAASEDTILISLLHVNNETGAETDVAKIARLASKLKKRPAIHVDGVQGFCKVPLPLEHIDLYSLSGHKIHALKGTGALVRKRGTILKPLLYGGGQQGNIRPGTENTPGIAALAAAARQESEILQSSREAVRSIRRTLAALAEEMDDVFINGDAGSDYILNMSFLGVKGETLVHALAEKGVFASTGSACGSRAKHGKSQLAKLGLEPQRLESAVRFSFSSQNTVEEAEAAKAVVRETAVWLRSSSRRFA